MGSKTTQIYQKNDKKNLQRNIKNSTGNGHERTAKKFNRPKQSGKSVSTATKNENKIEQITNKN